LTKGVEYGLLWCKRVKSGRKWENIMVIDCVQYRVANSDIFHFVKENYFTDLELRLLLFWARHPHAKVSLYTISYALDTARINLRDAIASLVKKSILVEQHSCGDLTTYYLDNNDSTLHCVAELAKMDWNQIKVLQKQLEGGAILD
jgi:hypothetical protein